MSGSGGAGGGFAKAAAGDDLRIGDLLAGVGGVLGLVESVLPSLLFLVLFQVTGQLVPAVVAPLALGVVLAGVRLLRRSSAVAAIGGLVGVVASAVLTLVTGHGADFFLFGIVTNTVYAVALLVSVLVGRPLLGVIVGFFVEEQRAWRSDGRLRRGYRWLTLLWVLLFAVRLLVELPLYAADATEALGVVRLITGIPLFAPLLVLSFLVVRALSGARRVDDGAHVS